VRIGTNLERFLHNNLRQQITALFNGHGELRIRAAVEKCRLFLLIKMSDETLGFNSRDENIFAANCNSKLQFTNLIF